MDKITFKKKAHPSFFVTCTLFAVFAIAFGFIPISSIFVYSLTHEINTREFALIFTTSSILWIALIIAILYLMKYTSFRIIIISDADIVFKSMFSKKKINICEITRIKKEIFNCGFAGIKYFHDYFEECINFETNKYKKTKYCLTSIPISALFNGTKDEVRKKFLIILRLLNDKKELVEEGLIKDVESMYDEYTKNGKIMIKKIYKME